MNFTTKPRYYPSQYVVNNRVAGLCRVLDLCTSPYRQGEYRARLKREHLRQNTDMPLQS